MCEFKKDLEEGIELSEIDVLFEGMRKTYEYDTYCMRILKRAYGVTKWNSRVTEYKISDFVTPSFESFVLLCYENCYEAVEKAEKVEQNEDSRSKGRTRKVFKWTSDARLTGRGRGWPSDAIRRYNTINEKVIESRRENTYWDENFLQDRKLEKENKKKRKRTGEEGTNGVAEVVAVNDFAGCINWAGI